jgi:hypothetical protein
MSGRLPWPRSRPVTHIGRRALDHGVVRNGTEYRDTVHRDAVPHRYLSRRRTHGSLLLATRSDGRRGRPGEGYGSSDGLSRRIEGGSCCGARSSRNPSDGRDNQSDAGRPIGHARLGRACHRHRCSRRRHGLFGRRSLGCRRRGVADRRRRTGHGCRRRTRRGRRHRLGNGRWRRRRVGRDDRRSNGRRHRRAGGQKRHRIEVALRLGSDANAEVHVRLGHLGVAADTDRPDAGALDDRGSPCDGDGAEVRQRHRVPLGGGDRHAVPRRWDGARKGDGSRRRREHRCTWVAAHVDPTVLARGIWMRRIEKERLQDGARGRPRPGPADRHEHERGKDRREQLTTHWDRLSRPCTMFSLRTSHDAVV